MHSLRDESLIVDHAAIRCSSVLSGRAVNQRSHDARDASVAGSAVPPEAGLPTGGERGLAVDGQAVTLQQFVGQGALCGDRAQVRRHDAGTERGGEERGESSAPSANQTTHYSL